MNDTLLKEFNLQPTCETMTKNNLYNCWNTLRFPDIENPTDLYVEDDFGIDNRVTCKLCLWHQSCINYAPKSMRYNEFYVLIKLSIHHTNQNPNYLVDKSLVSCWDAWLWLLLLLPLLSWLEKECSKSKSFFYFYITESVFRFIIFQVIRSTITVNQGLNKF